MESRELQSARIDVEAALTRYLEMQGVSDAAGARWAAVWETCGDKGRLGVAHPGGLTIASVVGLLEVGRVVALQSLAGPSDDKAKP